MRLRLRRGDSRCLVLLLLLSLCALSDSTRTLPWAVYDLDRGAFVRGRDPSLAGCSNGETPPAPLPPTPPGWTITQRAFADVTGDGDPEWVLLVWRPWQDWPIQSWLPVPSPISTYHDSHGNSCHLILLDPITGRERWAGSALPVPSLALAVGDIDGDGVNEVVTLEGDYSRSRRGPASHTVVWRWSDFGFSLVARSPAGYFWQLCLTDADNSSILIVNVR